MADTLILMVLALVVFGPRRLPQIGRQIGKLMYEFRKASNDFKFQMEEELRNAEEADRRKRDDASRQQTLSEAQKAAELAKSAAESALNAAAEIKAAQAAQLNAPEAVSPTEAAPAMPEESPAQPAESTTAESSPAETGLRVQPPSIGEQVAAARPGRAAIEPAPPEAEAAEPRQNITATDPSTAPEPSAHHG